MEVFVDLNMVLVMHLREVAFFFLTTKETSLNVLRDKDFKKIDLAFLFLYMNEALVREQTDRRCFTTTGE